MKKIILATVVCTSVFCGCDNGKQKKELQEKPRSVRTIEDVCLDLIGYAYDEEIEKCADEVPEAPSFNEVNSDIDVEMFKRKVAIAQQRVERAKNICSNVLQKASTMTGPAEECARMMYLIQRTIRRYEFGVDEARRRLALAEFIFKHKEICTKRKMNNWYHDDYPIFDDLALQFEFEELFDACELCTDELDSNFR